MKHPVTYKQLESAIWQIISNHLGNTANLTIRIRPINPTLIRVFVEAGHIRCFEVDPRTFPCSEKSAPSFLPSPPKISPE